MASSFATAAGASAGRHFERRHVSKGPLLQLFFSSIAFHNVAHRHSSIFKCGTRSQTYTVAAARRRARIRAVRARTLRPLSYNRRRRFQLAISCLLSYREANPSHSRYSEFLGRGLAARCSCHGDRYCKTDQPTDRQVAPRRHRRRSAPRQTNLSGSARRPYVRACARACERGVFARVHLRSIEGVRVSRGAFVFELVKPSGDVHRSVRVHRQGASVAERMPPTAGASGWRSNWM